jgi:hypothetical protein
MTSLSFGFSRVKIFIIIMVFELRKVDLLLGIHVQDFLSELFVVTGLLESLDNLLKLGLTFLVFEELHSGLVELKFINLFDDFEFDDDWLSEWFTFLANEAKLSSMFLLIRPLSKLSCILDLDRNRELEGLPSFDGEVNWNGNFIKEKSSGIRVVTDERSIWLPAPLIVVLNLNISKHDFAWCSSKSFLWECNHLGFFLSPDTILCWASLATTVTAKHTFHECINWVLAWECLTFITLGSLALSCKWSESASASTESATSSTVATTSSSSSSSHPWWHISEECWVFSNILINISFGILHVFINHCKNG